MQQIKFIIHTNIQPLPAPFLSKVKGQGQRFKKNSCKLDNLNFFYWISPIFYVKLPMSMKITWLDFQHSTDNQNGRHLATKLFFFDLIFFFIIPLKPGIYRFSGSASLLALSVFACNRKRGYGGYIYFSITKFLVNAITWKIIIGSLQFFMWCCPWVWRWPD